MNARSLLAEVTLVMSWICATFILPFYAVYAVEKGVMLVSLQIAAVMLSYSTTILVSGLINDIVGKPHVLNFASLLVVALGCWVMGMERVGGSTKFFDAQMGGYLLVFLGCGLISTTTFTEIL